MAAGRGDLCWWQCHSHQGWLTTKCGQWMSRQMALTPNDQATGQGGGWTDSLSDNIFFSLRDCFGLWFLFEKDGKRPMSNISIGWIHLFVFSIWIRKRDGVRVRRTLFLLGQSIIEPRGGFSCQLTFSPIYTRPHSTSSTSSTQNLPSCCQESNTNNRKMHVVPFLICINQYFLLMTPLLYRGEGG